MTITLQPRRQLSPFGQKIMGLGLFSIGAFIMAVALGWVPSAPKQFSAPNWVVGVMGSTFFCGGLALLMGPERRRTWGYRLVIFVILGGVASVASWIAFGDGPRQFTREIAVGGTLASTPVSEATGRTGFGIASIVVTAILVWSILRAAWRLNARRKDPSQTRAKDPDA